MRERRIKRVGKAERKGGETKIILYKLSATTMIFVIIGVERQEEKNVADQVSQSVPCSHDHVKRIDPLVCNALAAQPPLSSLFILFLRSEAFYLLLESIHMPLVSLAHLP